MRSQEQPQMANPMNMKEAMARVKKQMQAEAQENQSQNLN